jgi:hypothetical protein
MCFVSRFLFRLDVLFVLCRSRFFSSKIFSCGITAPLLSFVRCLGLVFFSKKIFSKDMADAELDAMLNDLGEMSVGSSFSSGSAAAALPSHWNETKPANEFQGKRHDDREVQQLLTQLDKNDGTVLRVRAPELPPVESSSAGKEKKQKNKKII